MPSDFQRILASGSRDLIATAATPCALQKALPSGGYATVLPSVHAVVTPNSTGYSVELGGGLILANASATLLKSSLPSSLSLTPGTHILSVPPSSLYRIIGISTSPLDPVLNLDLAKI